MRKVMPLNDRVVVKDEERKEKLTPSGLHIPSNVAEEGDHAIGDVLEVGQGFYKDNGEFIRPLNVKKGDKVLYGKYSGINAVINDVSVRLMQEIDILGIVKDE